MENVFTYSTNEIKIYNNQKLAMIEQVNYDTTLEKYNELIELINLFAHNSISKRRDELSIEKIRLDKKYLPIIKELKRILTNTKKRLKYNIHVVESK